MSLTAFLIILLVLGIIVSNIMLLKHSAKFPMTKVKQDPIENAKKKLKEREENEDNKG